MFVTKKRLLWATGLTLSPVALVLLLGGLLYLPPVQNWAVDRVAAIASDKTGMDISVGTVRLEWPLDLGIDGFLAVNEGDTLADVGHLSVGVQLRPLLGKRVVVNELALREAKLNTNGFISDLRIKGHVGELWLRSDGIDLDEETVVVNGARLSDANLDIALSDTAAVDTTTSEVNWRINADSLCISRTAVALHLPGDTLNIQAYMGLAVAREADINLGTSTYRVGSFDWHDGRFSMSPKLGGLGDLADIRLGVDSIYYGPLGTSLYIRETAMKERGSGLEIRELTGGVRLDTAYNHIELPHLVLRTADSDIEAEVSTDFNITDSLNPGKLRARLNAQIGKQDLLRLASLQSAGGSQVASFMRQYPNHPLAVKGSLNGNMKRLEFTGLDIHLPTALHVKADGFAANVDNPKQLRAQVRLKAETQNIDFVTALMPKTDFRIPHGMNLDGELKADRGQYDADFVLQEGNGTVRANISAPRLDDLVSYRADVKMSGMNLYHFLPTDSLFNHTADITAKLTMSNGHAIGTIGGQNQLIDGSIGIDALVGKTIEATITPNLKHIDLYALKLTDEPLKIGMDGSLTLKTDMKQSHEAKGRLGNLSITDKEKTYKPKDLGLLLRTNSDTTLARIQSGDFIVKLDGSGGYERLIKQGTTLLDTVTAQYNNRVIDQSALKRLLPTMKLHVESGRDNPVANILRMKDIYFKELLVDLNTSATTGVNGQMHLYSLVVDSTRIDTAKLNLTQKGERLTYQGQVRNNRKNRTVFNALFDGHLHEHGALVGARYYDAKDRMGMRVGATASMVDEGLKIQLMPERPTIGYKVYNLNKDNFVLLPKSGRVQAKIDLIADDKTGVKIYTNDNDDNGADGNNEAYLQDLTVSLHRIDLAELTSVMPYLPQLSGRLNGDYHIVMNQDERISVVSDMAVNDMCFEGSPIGNLSTELVYMQREAGGHAIEARLMLDDEEFGLLQGSYYPASSTSNTAASSQTQDRIDATFTMTRFPLSIANGFVTDQIIGLEGFGEGELTIKGTTKAPIVNGEVYLDSAYLVSQPYGVRMRFDNDPVTIKGSHLLLENFGLYAYNDEPLNIQGDIDFSNLDKVQMNMRMRARNLQLINTKQAPKSVASGKAFVNFFARINGPVDAMQMRGRLDVLGSTDLTYMLLDSPLSTDNRLDELVQFTDFNDTLQTAAVSRPKPSGVNMDLTISVSQGAHFVCNLNPEQTNYIDLTGGGDLRMRYLPDGLNLTGRYTLANGEMKYSMPIIPLKTFTIQDGSYVEFTGDPMNPRLNITATERVKAPVGQSDGQSRSVTFDCGVVVTKTLADMGLQFIISSPDDTNVNSELQAMSAEERSKIAVTMLTTGMYLTSGNTSGFSMNSALNSFLQSEINQITGSALKTLDLSVGLDNSTDASGQRHTDYSFKFSKRLLNNRLKIQLGGKVSTGSSDEPGQKQSFFDNVTMEYRMDQNGQKNVKLYYSQNVYDWLDGYTELFGAGFVWRKKMDSLLDVFKIFSSDSKQLTPLARPNNPGNPGAPNAPFTTTPNDSIRHEGK